MLYMLALNIMSQCSHHAELDEDENPDDDDAIEIPSKGKYKG